MMKTVKNRIGNAVLLSFMASFCWLSLGLAMCFAGNAELIDILSIVGVMFLILLLVFGIWVFIDNEVDFLVKRVIDDEIR